MGLPSHLVVGVKGETTRCQLLRLVCWIAMSLLPDLSVTPMFGGLSPPLQMALQPLSVS